ncbi:MULTISPECIES: hypothetical protein [Pseudomonas]|uniref:hypothetical protein n=1 Tax=Pseudomonas TaxID=286 RepID=UPI001070CC45|nr:MULTISPECIES: hypothetical protein [Pseudomonas]QBR29352.1 hypothetical protein E3Z29_01815 [Pseudomonas sp. S150]UZT92846.1 hypothetical protein OPS05_27845 [Pseudomonas koreensis]
MTETTSKKIEKWSYPLKAGATGATDPQQFYKALAKAKDGFYPLGANGLWHGGVHFDEASGLVPDLAEVKCIADGEVVAYRIDSTYPKSAYGTAESEFSTGFVLIKHRLEVPVPPAPPATAGAQSVAAAPGPSLTFFSLYMHLLQWKNYEEAPALSRPAFWSGGTLQVKATADDEILGLRVRLERRGKPGYGTVLTVLARGTVVQTGEEEDGWLKVVSVTPPSTDLTPGTGWVYKTEMTAGSTPNTYVIGTAAKDPMNPPQKGLVVRASASQSGAAKAILPHGTQVKIGNDGTRGKYQKLLEIVSGNAVPPLAAAEVLGYVWEGQLEAKSEPAEKDAVHVLTTPIPISAGSLIGHVGKYQNHSDSAPKNLLHVEVFSCEDVKAFTVLSKDKAAGLPAVEKTLVKIPQGSVLVTHSQGMSATNPPRVTDPHKTVGHDFFVPVGVLEALPAEKKIKAPVVMAGSTTYTLWWRLDGLLGDAEGNEISGWFAEPDTALSRHSPFEWEGFSFIEETGSNVDHLSAFLHAQQSLSEEEQATYSPNIDNAEDGTAKQRLYKILDRNGDKKLTPDEIKEALKKPWFSQPISQIVTQYESEWFYESEKWNALDEVMGHTDSEPNIAWQEEKVRIKRLGWLDKLAGKYGIDSKKLWHLHPIGFIGNFSGKSARKLITQAMLKAAKPSITDAYCEEILPYLNKYAALYKVDSPLRVAHFLAQVGHENGFKVTSEDLNYTAIGMRKQFGCRNNAKGYEASTDECKVLPRLRPKLWSEPETYAHNPVKLGSYVYADRNDNGNEASGEGYKYRGRGVIQLTGKYNYRQYTKIHNQADPSDPQDFVANPDLIMESIKYGVESAFVWWSMFKINQAIDDSLALRTMSDIDGHVSDISIKVNGGTTGLQERINLFKLLKDMVAEEMGL